MVIPGRKVQRRISIFLPGIDVGPVGKQQFSHVLVAIQGRPVQRSIAVVAFAGNQIRIVFEQCLDLCQVAPGRRITNLASPHIVPVAGGDDADPTQRQHRDGGAAGNRGAAEMDKERAHL